MKSRALLLSRFPWISIAQGKYILVPFPYLWGNVYNVFPHAEAAWWKAITPLLSDKLYYVHCVNNPEIGLTCCAIGPGPCVFMKTNQVCERLLLDLNPCLLRNVWQGSGVKNIWALNRTSQWVGTQSQAKVHVPKCMDSDINHAESIQSVTNSAFKLIEINIHGDFTKRKVKSWTIATALPNVTA